MPHTKTITKPRASRPVRRGVGISLTDHAYRLVKERILSNKLPGGFQILEDDLASQLKMSRTPLREALVRLANEGLLELVPRHGIRVVPLSIDDLHEIYQVLTSLETTAAMLLAAKKPNEKEVTKLRKAVEGMKSALNSNDLDAWAAADENFHNLLLDQCGNKRLATAARTFMDQSQRVRMVTLRLRDMPNKSTEYHSILVQAISRGDQERAREIHTRQKDSWRDEMLHLMSRYNIHQF
jgi:DNA-binding GntR family transcriptional regulator